MRNVSMRRAVPTALLALVLSAVAAAAQPVTAEDLFILQDALYDASRDVAAVAPADPPTAAQLQRELDTLRDGIVGLRTVFRQEGTVPRADYAALRARIEDVRTRARGESGPVPSGSIAAGPVAAAPVPAAAPAAQAPVPARGAPTEAARPEGCGPPASRSPSKGRRCRCPRAPAASGPARP
jgi:hypothetical protein